jgi:hypothetical protein
MIEPKEYEVPDEIACLFTEAEAMADLRDGYIKRHFGFKKARKCAIASQTAYRKAWRMLRELYPESSRSLEYQYVTRLVKETKP